MSIQKNIAVWLLFLAVIPDHTIYATKWIVLKDCTVTVNGSTNINRFACSVPGYQSDDTLTCFRNNDGTVIKMKGGLDIPVDGFDCANPMMTKDLRKTIQSKMFPYLRIQFISLKKYPLLKTAQENIAGIVSIELAGVKKQMEVNYTISMDEKGIVYLRGTQSIHFSDFNLVAPRKLGGMIKTNDRLEVVFTIHCRIIKP